VEAVEDLADDSRAAALNDRIRSVIADWRAALEMGTLAQDATLRRLALDHAAYEGDVDLIFRLEAAGCNLNERFRGGGNILDHVLSRGHLTAATRLIEHGIDPQTALVSGAHVATPAIVRLLLTRGADVTAIAAQAAARADLGESAAMMIDALALRNREALIDLSERAEAGAKDLQASADLIATGAMWSDRTTDEHRAEANRLVALAAAARRVLTGDGPTGV
jgi:hypothetical protein